MSARQIAEVESVFNLLFDGIAGKAPSHQNVLDWVLKYGVSLANLKCPLELKNKSLIIDNSVNMNGQELHVELIAPANHPGHTLKHNDVSLARMTVNRKWDTEMIKEQLGRTIARGNPAFVVSDNAGILCNACRDLGLKHHRDISHSFGIFLERIYGNSQDLTIFNQKMAYSRKFSHTEIGCLMPPKRREYARFMNLFDRIDWAYYMLHNFYKLPQRGKQVFYFVMEQSCFIEEMKDVMDWYRHLEKLCKEEGLSRHTAQECRRFICKTFMHGDERLRDLGRMLIDYFTVEESLLETDDAVHNISSDIIESAFGYLKGRLSLNKNNGFTSLVLLLPVHLRVANLDSCEGLNVQTNMADTRLADIKDWRRKNLLDNPMVKRKETLSKVV